MVIGHNLSWSLFDALFVLVFVDRNEYRIVHETHNLMLLLDIQSDMSIRIFK
jgi:hypothetical protein